MRDGLTYQGHDHREAIDQLFELNDLLPLMAEGATKFEDKEFHWVVIPASLRPTVRVEFIKKAERTSESKTKACICWKKSAKD